MKFFVKQMKENESTVLEEELNPADLDMDIGIMHFPSEISVRAEAWKSEDDLSIAVHVEAEREFTCSSCLEEFNNLFEKDFSLHYDIKGLDSVEIDSDVRDEIILEHPIRILCRKDCQGLCPTCGANLNEGPCDCKEV